MKNIPNILSISRILVSGLLFFLMNEPALFTALYLYCGISDVADGYLARKFNVESSLGAKLDSLGDFIMYSLIVVVFLMKTKILQNDIIVGLLIFIFLLKFFNFLLIKVKFKQWGMLHTIGDKCSGIIVYLILPVYILFPGVSFILLILVCAFAALVTVEETLILFTSDAYSANRKSIFTDT